MVEASRIHRSDNRRDFLVLTRNRVRVDRQSCRDVVMAKPFAQNLDVDACSKRVGSERVPHVVKADVGYAGPLQGFAEGMAYRTRIKRSTVIMGKDKVIIFQGESQEGPFGFIYPGLPP